VVSALSSARPSDCVAHLVRAHGLRKVEHLVFGSRADDTVPTHGLSERVSSLVGHRKQDVARDISSAIELLQVNGLPYVVLKTTGLTDEPGGKRIVSGEVGQSRPGPVGRADLARFILDMLNAPGWDLREVNVGVA